MDVSDEYWIFTTKQIICKGDCWPTTYLIDSITPTQISILYSITVSMTKYLFNRHLRQDRKLSTLSSELQIIGRDLRSSSESFTRMSKQCVCSISEEYQVIWIRNLYSNIHAFPYTSKHFIQLVCLGFSSSLNAALIAKNLIIVGVYKSVSHILY